jgi:hypothetical protein
MRKVNYVFKFYDLETKTFYTLKNDIDEWQSFGISYGREKEKTTFVKSYVANFTFVKEDAAWLRNIIFTRGFNVRIAIYVYSADMFGTLTTQYRGFLDLTNAEITSVFKCPIYSGGFFNSLDNCWTTQYDLSPSEIKGIFNFEFTKFRNYTFNGGSYLYDERLTLCNGTENCITEFPATGAGISDVVFLPFKPSSGTTNDDIGYFNKNVTQSLASVLNDSSDANVNCCFITSNNKANVGTMKFNLLNVGTLKIRDLDLILGSNYSNVAKIGYRITLQIVIYDEVRDATWNFWKHLLIETNYPALVNDNPIIQRQDIKACTIVPDSETPPRKNAVISGVELTGNDFYYDSAISDYYDFSFLKDDNAKRGYRIGVCLSNIENVTYYDSSNVQVVAGSGANPSSARTPEFIFNENFSIDIVINEFTLNRNKNIHGVTAEDVFIDLIKNINTKQYNINIDTSLLTNKVGNVVLFSDLGLLGSTLDLNENNIEPIIKTSISDFLDTIYKVWGLQMYCRYDISLNKYFITFVELANTMQNVKIETLTNIASLIITPARDLMSTELAVGYEIAEDSFFGRYEFNCKNTFKTTNSESEVILKDYVSKYNASVFDIETYIYKMNRNFKDSKGNGKVFLISMDETENIIYAVNDGKINNTINVLLRPSANLSRHYKELAGMTYFNRVLTFISSTMNGDFAYGGRAENDTITILESPYFIPFEATIEVPAVTDLVPKIEANPLGYFEFTYNDKIYRGYIAEGTESLTINPMNEQSSVLRLLLTNTSEL